LNQNAFNLFKVNPISIHKQKPIFQNTPENRSPFYYLPSGVMKDIPVESLKVVGQISLKDQAISFDLECSEKKKDKVLKKYREKLSDHQGLMYAHNKYSVLICL
jgi:hypothetical protein